MLHKLCRGSGSSPGCIVVFQNVEFLRRFGLPRVLTDHGAIPQQLSSADKQEQDKWFSKILLVSTPQLLLLGVRTAAVYQHNQSRIA